MNIVVSGIHLEKFPEMEDYAKKKVAKLSKFHSKIEEINVRLIEKASHRGQEQDYYCEITVHVPGKVLEIIDNERAMDKAIDKALERMKQVLIKHKEKQITIKHRLGILTKFKNRFFKS